MAGLQVRPSVQGYVRDTYLGKSVRLNPDLEPIDCAIGSSRWGISESAIQSHHQFDPRDESRYPEMFHDTLLKPTVMAHFEGAGLTPDMVFFGHGSFNLAERLIHKLVVPSKMLGVGPQFNEVPTEFVAAGGEYIPLPIDDASHDYAIPMEQLKSELGTGKCAILYLDNPNNPLGRVVSLEDLAELIPVAERHGTIVLIDEAYGDFIEEKFSAAYLVNRFTNLAVIRSCSKGLGLAAARVGYMFLSRELAELYSRLDVPFEPTLHAAVLGAATLQDKVFIASVRLRVAEVKALLIPAFISAGFEILPTHPTVSIMTIHRDGRDVVSEMASLGVSVEAGSAFKQTNPVWDDSYCRIRVPASDDARKLAARLSGVTDIKARR